MAATVVSVCFVIEVYSLCVCVFLLGGEKGVVMCMPLHMCLPFCLCVYYVGLSTVSVHKFL